MDTPVTFSYDPQRQGYDTTQWKTLTGSPSAVGYIADVADSEALSLTENLTLVVS